MSDSINYLYISECHQSFLEKIRLKYYDLLGYEILLFCKNNKEKKSIQYQENDYGDIDEYDFSIAFHNNII